MPVGNTSLCLATGKTLPGADRNFYEKDNLYLNYELSLHGKDWYS